MIEIIFATGNKSKLTEAQFVADYLELPVKFLNGREVYGEKIAYDEVGETVEEVARNGAMTVAKLIGMPVITDDTDFRVEALDGAPGIRSGEFLKNFGRGEILKRMMGQENRKAIISSALAYATPDGEIKVFLNTVKGTIADQEKSGNFPDWISPTKENPFGGGYNSIFIPDGWDKTLAEISPEDSIPWSYRERNFVDLCEYLTGVRV